VVALSVLIFASSSAFAATIYVGPGEAYTEIQPAIDAAVNGDEIIVRDGTYAGPNNKNLDFGGKAITLISENGAASCVIDCENDGRGFYFHNSETASSIVDGFTIRNGMAVNGGGIHCYYFSSPTIRNSIISGNSADRGGAIYCWSDAAPTISNCVITENYANYFGGGIRCRGSSPTITDSTISANSSAWGGGISCWVGSSPNILNCIISENTAFTYSGGGIALENSSSATIANCTISNNSSVTGGGGIYCFYQSSPTLTNCIVAGNSAGYHGAGIHCYSYVNANLINCTISDNLSTTSGGGISSDFHSDLTLINCILWDDTPNETLIGQLSTITATYSDVEGGYAGDGNIDSDPLLDADYRLLAGSPCIDAGTDAGVYDDTDGDIRPLGAGYDMGADEFVPCYDFYGFLEPLPLVDSGEVKTFKSNRVIPVKFNIFDSLGMEITSLTEPPVISVMYTGSTDAAGEPEDYDVTGRSDDGNAFRYAGDCWIFNLSMRSFAINSEYDIIVTIPETGCAHTCSINLVK
jgi:parallel beta-helix repeat protein